MSQPLNNTNIGLPTRTSFKTTNRPMSSLQYALQGGTHLVGRDPWWKSGVFYQVYPASFKDSNGDGWGDIPGLISRLDYLASLGVDCIWLSPIFDSPQVDMGYDVSNYQAIYPLYGTVADVDRLIDECHRRGVRLILDLVVNHTSVEHAWFKESRSSRNNPKRDWYIWKPPRYDAKGRRIPPTNWRGYFASATWTWDEPTQEYYLHLYAPDQPDLNWENADCREAIYNETMRFWLDRGVDGFRIDTVNKFSKRTDFVDAPITDPRWESQPAPEMWCNGPRIHEFLHEMHRKVLAPYGAVSVGELSNMSGPADVLPYVSATAQELDMVFEFSMIRLGTGGGFGQKYMYEPFRLSELKQHVSRFQTFIEGTDGWTTVFCENHDNGRAVSRFGDTGTPELWNSSAKTLALWQATLTGTLFLYQGQEIGMVNMPSNWGIKEYKDVESRSFYADAVASGDGERIRHTMRGLQILARDHARIPFQWDGDRRNAGFTDGHEPWMKVHDGYRDINVARQTGDPGSILEFWRKVLRLRKGFADLLVHGAFRGLIEEDERLYVYLKESSVDVAGKVGTKRRALVVMNWSRDVQKCFDLREALGCASEDVRLLISTGDEFGPSMGAQGVTEPVLRPWEGRVYVNFEPGALRSSQTTLSQSTTRIANMSYAAVTASGPKQTPEEAAAPPPVEIVPSESASTSSLVDVDTPSVRTVPSDFTEQDVQTQTQADRIDREEELAEEHARAEADLAKKKVAGKARKADNVLTRFFGNLSNGTSTALVISNLVGVIGLSGFLGYKAWDLHERGRLGWKNIGLGLGIVGLVGAVEGVFGRYLQKGKKKQS